jgi:hypothetical protein
MRARRKKLALWFSFSFDTSHCALIYWSHIENPVVDFSDIPNFHNVRRFGDYTANRITSSGIRARSEI